MRLLGKPGTGGEVIVWWTSTAIKPILAIVGRGMDGGGSGAEKVDLSG